MIIYALALSIWFNQSRKGLSRMKLLYFAWVREHIGKAEEDIALPKNINNISELLTWLALQSDGHASALCDTQRLRVAVNQTYVKSEHIIQDSDEIAIFPPVTGG